MRADFNPRKSYRLATCREQRTQSQAPTHRMVCLTATSEMPPQNREESSKHLPRTMGNGKVGATLVPR